MSDPEKPKEKPAEESPGPYTIVYLPVDPPVRDEPQPMEPVMMKAATYAEAMTKIQDFMESDDFIADIDCRFEIFDGDLQPVSDQNVIEDMLIEAYRRQEAEVEWGVEGSDVPLSKEVFVGREEILFEEEKKPVATTPATPAPTESKEVKFSDIKIEDGR